MNDDFTIRPAASIADYTACQDAQRRAWGITDDTYIVPLATLVGAQLHGGLVLGAFLADGSAAGLSFAFLGRVEGRLCLYSQLTGIVPGRQGQGIGLKIKHAQRDFCRREGIDRIAWSFDPLQSGNASFNLGHLGAVAVKYIPDMYGSRSDALNTNTPTDRLIVEWSVDAAKPQIPSVDPTQADRLIDVFENPDGTLEPIGTKLPGPGTSPTMIEIPADIGTLRRDDSPRAEAWGKAVRQAFTAVFAAGRVASGFLRDDSTGRRRCFYVVRPRSG